MKFEEYFLTWWKSRLENPILFYLSIAFFTYCIAAIILNFRKKRIKKRNQKKLFEEQKRIEQEVESKRRLEELAKLKEDLESKLKVYHPLTVKITESQNILSKKVAKVETEGQPTGKIYKNDELKKESQVKEDDVTYDKKPPVSPSATKSDSNEVSNITKSTTLPKKLVVNPDEILTKIIQSVPDPEKSTPKRIGYLPNNQFYQLDPYSYPVVKMPNKNSLIKFPRKGRSDKKGYKEDSFKEYLDEHFKSFFSILNDRHVPTSGPKPYEPDLILVNEKDNKNIFIDIEIDEPYDGVNRIPTHCIAYDDVRDNFFTKRGWIVIRFTEEQIHKNPLGCCSFISNVISTIDNGYTAKIITNNQLIPQLQWDSLQAKKWANSNYREKYLVIPGFGVRPPVNSEYIITECSADLAVETAIEKDKDIVKPPQHTNETNEYLSQKNAVERDSRISFDSKEHRYSIDNNPDTISVTQLIDKFFPEFDSAYWAPIKAEQRGISVQEILDEWDAKAKDAADKGTALHESIEGYYKKREHNSNSKEFQQFLAFKSKYTTMQPFRSEWRIFDEDLMIAGTVDMVYKKDENTYYIFDWKRSEKIINNDGTKKNTTFQFASGELSHLGDNSYNRYCLQLNIYKSILEKRYKQKISSMNILVLHECYEQYYHVVVPDMQKEANYVLNSLRL